MHQAVYAANRAANAENLAHSKARNSAGQQHSGGRLTDERQRARVTKAGRPCMRAGNGTNRGIHGYALLSSATS